MVKACCRVLAQCLNFGQTGQASETHQGWLDFPLGFNCAAPYGAGFTSGDMILWQLKARIELRIGEGLIFRGAIIAHKVTETTSGVHNSIDLFAHKSTYDVKAKADERVKSQDVAGWKNTA